MYSNTQSHLYDQEDHDGCQYLPYPNSNSICYPFDFFFSYSFSHSYQKPKSFPNSYCVFFPYFDSYSYSQSHFFTRSGGRTQLLRVTLYAGMYQQRRSRLCLYAFVVLL